MATRGPHERGTPCSSLAKRSVKRSLNRDRAVFAASRTYVSNFDCAAWVRVSCSSPTRSTGTSYPLSASCTRCAALATLRAYSVCNRGHRSSGGASRRERVGMARELIMVVVDAVSVSVTWASVVAVIMVSRLVVKSVTAVSTGHVRRGGMLSCRAVVKCAMARALHLMRSGVWWCGEKVGRRVCVEVQLLLLFLGGGHHTYCHDNDTQIHTHILQHTSTHTYSVHLSTQTHTYRAAASAYPTLPPSPPSRPSCPSPPSNIPRNASSKNACPSSCTCATCCCHSGRARVVNCSCRCSLLL